jgi:pilus assembly protein Flp/PilA
LFSFTRRRLPLPKERGQGLAEYALILSLVAILIIVILAVMGTSIKTAYCQVISQFPGGENPCSMDVVVVKIIDYNSTSGNLHIDATSDGDYNPDVTLTAHPGGVMGATAHHYHLAFTLEPDDCPCTVTVISSEGGSASVIVDP